MAVPAKPRSTVTACVLALDSVAVNFATPAFSAIVAWSTAKVTVGALSSSAIVVVAVCVPDSVPLVTPVMSTTTVSPPSKTVSGTAVTVTKPLSEPAAITICVPVRV